MLIGRLVNGYSRKKLFCPHDGHHVTDAHWTDCVSLQEVVKEKMGLREDAFEKISKHR